MNNKEKGALGEQIASNYLSRCGFEIIERNYKTKCGEIDLIAKKEATISFVEVKSRNSLNYGYPCEGVNIKKQNKIKTVAKEYILRKNLKNFDYSFDIVEVYLKDKKINYMKNAF
ncbi:YraN family protein [Alkalithermobacter paradoxus]|uniref:UPF0102 protein CLOTH_14000 n=1 Tax=Alkalithermobacter paradoxus TaxID=29349 RepID=A0A1V4I6P1_9FIRM|nr:hypothetical protein CLOTH_14000 [[Clostridium] thermoalcaliphilum]